MAPVGVPSGWTPAGMVEHLSGAELHWFQGVVAGSDTELPGNEDLPFLQAGGQGSSPLSSTVQKNNSKL